MEQKVHPPGSDHVTERNVQDDQGLILVVDFVGIHCRSGAKMLGLLRWQHSVDAAVCGALLLQLESVIHSFILVVYVTIATK